MKIDSFSNTSSSKRVKDEGEPKPPKGSKALEIAGEVLFYGLLILLVAAALCVRTTNGLPRTFAGYSAMIVLTESMQSEIPKGSLVITRQTDPQTLQIGDDITYLANHTTTVTHRIVGITENYEDTGQRAFETKGLMNAQADKLPVPAVNVVGKVVYHSEILGNIAVFIGTYKLLLIFTLSVLMVLVNVLKRIFKASPKESAA